MTAIVGVDLDAIEADVHEFDYHYKTITDLVAELRALRTQRDAVVAYLDEVAAEAAAPPYPIPPAPWVVKIRQRLGLAPNGGAS